MVRVPQQAASEKEKAILTNQQKKAYEALRLDDKKNTDDIQKPRLWTCRNFFDVGTFGAVMSLKDYSGG